ncbi:MAG: NAD(+) synthase [Syntrophales bacterium]|jgi:NAD+ synthase (glutamine-hydrolysing)|nr:NAD(+) synthase [Syntrophales bacterium]
MKTNTGKAFFNLYHHGFIRAAVCVPDVRVGDPDYNTEKTIELINEAARGKAVFALFPELGLSAYSNEDLFHQDALLQGVIGNITRLLEATANLAIVTVVGAPLQVGNRLFNCGIVTYGGAILGVSVKTYLPNYREFYERRQFSPAEEALTTTIDLCGHKDVPFGPNIIFEVETIPNFRFHTEIGEDLWVPVPPSSFAALAGATVLANLAASNASVGKADYRRDLTANQSARCVAAYLHAAAGYGESTTDLAWDGHAMIHENGKLLVESERFSRKSQIIFADIDLDRLAQDRMRLNSFGESARVHRPEVECFRKIPFSVEVPMDKELLLDREYPRFPYVPADAGECDQRCFEVYNIQVQGLAKRLAASRIPNIIIGVSGGLDSTHALLVAARTMDLLDRPRTHIKAYTMPGFATTDRTLGNARKLMSALGVSSGEIDIRPSCRQMLQDIGHPYHLGKPVYDVTFENVQAGERTSHLFRLANHLDALVVGTGDLSELALGWCTYGVGDHMSHYNVNAGVPKTLIQRLIRWVADTGRFSPQVSRILTDILETEISPELIPGEGNAQPAQKTEEVIGPYELQDFNLFYTIRFGYLPTKIAFLAYCTWRDAQRGSWPNLPDHKKHAYSLKEIKHWLEVFIHRFFQVNQFKRSCVPNGPKIGSGGSLSPRGDYRAPSDAEARVWLNNWEDIPDRY